MSTSIGAQKLTGALTQLYLADGDDFVSRSVDSIELDYEGIVGDYHFGLTRKSGGREPWYKRGTEMRNERHVSILSEEELADIARKLDISNLEAGRIGANFVTRGIPNLSLIPARTQFFFFLQGRSCVLMATTLRAKFRAKACKMPMKGAKISSLALSKLQKKHAALSVGLNVPAVSMLATRSKCGFGRRNFMWLLNNSVLNQQFFANPHCDIADLFE